MYDRGKIILGLILFVAAAMFPIWANLATARTADKPGLKPVEPYVDPSLTPPTYHLPLKKWRANHLRSVKKGARTRYECVLCHEPPRHCNRCHRYMGVRDFIDRPVAPPMSPQPAPSPPARSPASQP